VVGNRLLLEIADQIGLELLSGIVVYYGWDLELVNIEVFQPFWMARDIDPGIVDWHRLGLLVKG